MNRFEAAPWPASLKAVSFLGTAAVLVAGFFASRAIPRGTGVPFAETLGTVVACVPPMIAVVAALFVVRSYEVDPSGLRIQRLLWVTRVPLQGLTQAWHDPSAMRGALRLFGNGGLFSVTGLFRSGTLGTFRAFVTDPASSVVLKLPSRTVVVSPADPAAFLRQVELFFPPLHGSAPGRPST